MPNDPVLVIVAATGIAVGLLLLMDINLPFYRGALDSRLLPAQAVSRASPLLRSVVFGGLTPSDKLTLIFRTFTTGARFTASPDSGRPTRAFQLAKRIIDG